MALTSVQTFYRPDDKNTVVELLKKHEESALIVAGGTFLHGLISRGLLYGIEALIDIQKLELDKINSTKESVELGATTKFIQLIESDIVTNSGWLGAVKDALEYPPMQVMNSATIGGSVASSCPFFDLPTSFLALNANVHAYGGSGLRDIPMHEFFVSLFENALEVNEFVICISLPNKSENNVSAFIKMESNANDLAILNTAVSLDTNGKDKCNESSIWIGGGVGESPVRAVSAEAILNDTTLDDKTIEDAANAAMDDVEPLSDHRASAEYRKAMTAVIVKRALLRALERLN